MTWKKIVGVVAIIVLAMLVFRGCGEGRGMMGDHDDDHGGPSSAQGVTVQATGSVKVVPDGVSFNFAVSVLAQSSETAMSEASATAELVRSALETAGVAKDAGLRKVKVYVKGPGNGRESAIRSIHNAGIEVAEIIDVTPTPHNGCRPPKRRRV